MTGRLRIRMNSSLNPNNSFLDGDILFGYPFFMLKKLTSLVLQVSRIGQSPGLPHLVHYLHDPEGFVKGHDSGFNPA
jgi:hypothetical protein